MPLFTRKGLLLSLVAILPSYQAGGVTLFEDTFDYPIGQDLPPLYFSIGATGRAVVERGLEFPAYDLQGGSVGFDGPSIEMETELDFGVPINNSEVDQTATFFVGFFLRITNPGTFGNGVTGVAIFNEADPGKEGLLVGTVSSGVGEQRQELAVVGVGARPADAFGSENLAANANLLLEPETTYFVVARFDSDLNKRSGALRGYLKIFGPEDPIPLEEPTEWDLSITRDKQWPMTERNKVLDRIQIFRGNTATRVSLDDLRVVSEFSDIVNPVRIPEASTVPLLVFLASALLRRRR